MSEEKIGNFTHGGSDTRDGDRPLQGSDTKEFYTVNRTSKTGTFAHDADKERPVNTLGSTVRR